MSDILLVFSQRYYFFATFAFKICVNVNVFIWPFVMMSGWNDAFYVGSKLVGCNIDGIEGP